MSYKEGKKKISRRRKRQITSMGKKNKNKHKKIRKGRISRRNRKVKEQENKEGAARGEVLRVYST